MSIKKTTKPPLSNAEKKELAKQLRNSDKSTPMADKTEPIEEIKEQPETPEQPKFSSDLNQLANEFAKPTEPKAAKSPTIEFFPDEEQPTFSSEPEPTPEPEPVKPSKAKEIPDITTNMLSAETTAGLFVGGIDVIQQQIFKFILQAKVKNKIGKKADKLELESLLDEVDAGVRDILDIEIEKRSLIRMMQKANAKIEALNLSDDEFEDLEITLTAIIKDHPGYQLPPHYGLALAAAKIFIPRLIDTLSA